MSKAHFEIKHFRDAWNLGFDKQVLPIIEGTKRPGVRWENGLWGCPPDWWNSLRLREDQLDQVQSFYGNKLPSMGFRCEQILFIDVDAVDPRLIVRIEQILIDVLGYLPPKRWGRRPGYMLRLAKSMKSLAKVYLPKDESSGETQAIDFLGEGRQFVVAGRHKDQPEIVYWWEGGLPRFTDLTIVTEQQIRDIYNRIAALPGADAAKVVDFDHSKAMAGEGETAPAEQVRAVVMGCMPNDGPYDDFEKWMRVCYAIINAIGPAEGYHLALDWTMTWHGDLDIAKAEKAIIDFCRSPRGDSGYKTLLHFASKQSGWTAVRKVESATAAEVWFLDEPEPEAAPQPDAQPRQEDAREQKAKPEPFTPIPFSDLDNAPPIDWLVDEMIPHGELTCFYGDSRAFKSFCALDLAHRIVHRMPDWAGMKLKARKGTHVVYLSGEGIQGLARRHKAWNQHHEIAKDNRNADRLLLIGDQIALVEEREVRTLAKAIGGYAKGKPVDMIIIDTFGRAIGDNENDTDVMRKALNCCETLARTMRTTVLLVHHLNKKGLIRGNTSLFNGANTMAEFSRSDEKLETVMTATKVKDSKEGDQWQCVFIMEKVADSIVPTFIKRMTADQREARQSRASARSELGQSNLADVLAALNELPQRRGTVKQITAKLDGKLTRRTVQDKIDILIERGLVKQSGIQVVHGGRGIVYQAENATLGDDPGGKE